MDTNLKPGVYLNSAYVGYYSDQQNQAITDAALHQMLDRFDADGYTGIVFEITAAVSTAGDLQDALTYDRLFELVDYAESIGLGTGVLVNWTFDGGNASYIGQTSMGQTRPAEFSMDRMIDSMESFLGAMAPRLEAHGVETLYLGNQTPDFFAHANYDEWAAIIGSLRHQFSGTLSAVTWSGTRDAPQSLVDETAIWGLLDAITMWSKPLISETPIYDLEEIVSGYFRSAANGTSLVQEVIDASIRYDKPVILMGNFFSLDNALNGGWDPTAAQSMASPLPTNDVLQELGYRSFLHVVANHLHPFVTGINIANYEPWALQTYTTAGGLSPDVAAILNTFKHFSMTLFPEMAEGTLAQYLANPDDFHATDVTIASPGDDTIYTSTGTNRVYLNGGFDTAFGGTGPDTYVLEEQAAVSYISFNARAWVTANAASTVDIYLGTLKIGSFSVLPDAQSIAAHPQGYWSDSERVVIETGTGLDAASIKFVLTQGLNFVAVDGLVVELGDGEVYLDTGAGDHVPDVGWARPNWVVGASDLVYRLDEFDRPSRTSIDGGAGIDVLEFNGAMTQGRLQLVWSNGTLTATDSMGSYPPVALTGVERISFGADKLAFDLVDGHAGTVARFLGVLVGSADNPAYVGAGISLLDAGMSAQTLMGLALDLLFGEVTHEAFVERVYSNLVGELPSPAESAYFVSLLDSAAVTRVQLALLAAGQDLNASNIDLVGLRETGLAYQ